MNQGYIFLSCYFLCSLFCYLIDVMKPDFRVKKESLSVLNREYCNMLPIATLNSLIGTGVLNIIDNHLSKKENLNDHYFITNFILWLFVTDFWFYFLHRLFHQKALYKFHKVHHDYSYTFGMGAIYAHPLDFVVTNAGSELL